MGRRLTVGADRGWQGRGPGAGRSPRLARAVGSRSCRGGCRSAQAAAVRKVTSEQQGKELALSRDRPVASTSSIPLTASGQTASWDPGQRVTHRRGGPRPVGAGGISCSFRQRRAHGHTWRSSSRVQSRGTFSPLCPRAPSATERDNLGTAPKAVAEGGEESLIFPTGTPARSQSCPPFWPCSRVASPAPWARSTLTLWTQACGSPATGRAQSPQGGHAEPTADSAPQGALLLPGRAH